MRLITSLFQRNGMDVPEELSFENLSKQFMGLVAERYPSSDKVKDGPFVLGIERWIMAKIIALSQFRDAIREVALNQIYRIFNTATTSTSPFSRRLKTSKTSWKRKKRKERMRTRKKRRKNKMKVLPIQLKKRENNYGHELI